MSKNFAAFLKREKKGFENKYVVLINSKMVATGLDIEKMLVQVRKKYPEGTPFVAKIHDEKSIVFESKSTSAVSSSKLLKTH